MSQMLVGQTFDAIYHTSVVVYGVEFFYGGDGITRMEPGSTQYGTPIERIRLGETGRSKAEFTEWIATVSDKFRFNNYHLIDHNCNHFTQEASQFLCGADIPDRIRRLPAEFLGTPMGQMMGGMIEQMFGQTRTAPLTSGAPTPSQGVSTPSSSTPSEATHPQAQAPAAPTPSAPDAAYPCLSSSAVCTWVPSKIPKRAALLSSLVNKYVSPAAAEIVRAFYADKLPRLLVPAGEGEAGPAEGVSETDIKIVLAHVRSAAEKYSAQDWEKDLSFHPVQFCAILQLLGQRYPVVHSLSGPLSMVEASRVVSEAKAVIDGGHQLGDSDIGRCVMAGRLLLNALSSAAMQTQLRQGEEVAQFCVQMAAGLLGLGDVDATLTGAKCYWNIVISLCGPAYGHVLSNGQ
ncbi:hypothetical protein KIPB_007433, partial [Kipferlia bialata]|eukprot:g7433.t1